MLIFLTILWLLVVISFLVFIHEFGHFLAAKLMGVHVHEFGIGYPPRVWKLFKWQGTWFTINALPFGGFVRMHGDEGETVEQGSSGKSNGLEMDSPDLPESASFNNKSKWRRLVIIVGGVTVNFLFGALAFAYIYSRVGIPEETGQVEIVEVQPDSPAASADLQVGDDIVYAQTLPNSDGKVADQQKIASTNLLLLFLGSHVGETVEFKLIRSGQEISKQVYVRTEQESQGQGAVGIALSDREYVFYPAWQMPFRGIVVGFRDALEMGGLILQALEKMVLNIFRYGQVPTDVSGVVGIADQAVESKAVYQSFLGHLNTAAMLSINLAIMNMLPIPVLDGGRAVFIILESVIGKQRRAKWEQRANQFGFFFLMGLLILITVKDVLNIF